MLPAAAPIRQIYLDYAATTPVDPDVLSAMLPYFTEQFGNPSSLYRLGRAARSALNKSRTAIAECIHAQSENIVFVGGGTEANNLALFGVLAGQEKEAGHIISVSTEHESVIRPLQELERRGWEVTYLPVDKNGLVNTRLLLGTLRPTTRLVSVMYANNEIGTVQPIAELGREINRYRQQRGSGFPYFHTDACQAAGFLSLDVEKLHVDLMSVNAGKIYGPKGSGFLYIRRGLKIKPIFFGGGQEKQIRSGTENVAGAVGMAKALERAEYLKPTETDRLRDLSAYFWAQLQMAVPQIVLNGPPFGPDRLPNNLNIAFSGVESEALLLYLDRYGIMCSAGSACATEALDTSHVLRAIDVPPELARSSIRFTLGRKTSRDDIDYVIDYLRQLVPELRQMKKIGH